MTTATKVFTGSLHRVQRGHAKGFSAAPRQRQSCGPPASPSVMLALAHKVQEAIDDGKVRDRADVARRLGFTRARASRTCSTSRCWRRIFRSTCSGSWPSTAWSR